MRRACCTNSSISQDVLRKVRLRRKAIQLCVISCSAFGFLAARAGYVLGYPNALDYQSISSAFGMQTHRSRCLVSIFCIDLLHNLPIAKSSDSNIAFSTIVGFGVFISPSADYFAHHYLSGAMIVWGSFVSILILCLPKLHAIVLLIRKKRNPGRLSGLYQTFNWRKPAEENELVSINRMIANPNLSFANRFTTSTAPNVPTNIHQRHTFRSGDSSKGYTSEAYEVTISSSLYSGVNVHNYYL